MSYRHLSAVERTIILYCSQYGLSQREIALRLGRAPATISRELRRGKPVWSRYYNDVYARHQAVLRRHRARHRRRAEHRKLVAYVHAKLAVGWPPEAIANRLRLDYPRCTAMRISAEQIYQWAYTDAREGGKLYRGLRRAHRRRRPQCRLVRAKRGIKGRVGIEKRPAVVTRRGRFGDWEGDTVEGRKGTGLLATHIERKSGYLVATKLESKHPKQLAAATVQAFRHVPRRLRHTLTYDNGREFACFKVVEKKSGFSVYFADPHAPWQRGCNENANGLLRQFLPKGSDFATLETKALAQIVHMLNNRPRKRLAYRTPAEVLAKVKRVALAT